MAKFIKLNSKMVRTEWAAVDGSDLDEVDAVGCIVTDERGRQFRIRVDDASPRFDGLGFSFSIAQVGRYGDEGVSVRGYSYPNQFSAKRSALRVVKVL